MGRVNSGWDIFYVLPFHCFNYSGTLSPIISFVNFVCALHAKIMARGLSDEIF